MHTERAKALFPLFDCSLPLAADRARAAAYFVVARRREACQLAPPQHSSPLGLVLAALAPSFRHGGARSGASDDEVGGPPRAIARAAHEKGRSRLLMSNKPDAASRTATTPKTTDKIR
jgi:hypothetical protein